ncbi:MAG TPA: CsgG/HfaB family protein [Nitrospinota bacterium]|nr:CsgG/HfaB family protein [Nitrospinota bacterium]
MRYKFNLVIVVTIALMLASTGAWAKSKPRMGVLDFKNTTRAHWWGSGVGRELAGMLTNELVSTGKFKMVERKKLKSVLREQDLGASGRVRKGTAAKVGQLTGAKYLITATVTAYEEGTSKRGAAISFGGVSIGGKKSKAYMAVDLRVINSTTGDIDYVRTIEATSTSGGLGLGLSLGGFSGRLGGEEKTPAGKAIRACVLYIAEYLECAMVTKGSCMSEFDAAEQKRKGKTKKAIELD